MISLFDAYILVSVALTFSIGLFWFLFQTYLMLNVVRRVDAIVDPIEDEVITRRGDSLFFRWHRLSMYSLSSCGRFLNRRVCPDFDFRELPKRYRIRFQINACALFVGSLIALTAWVPAAIVGHF